jgi:methyl-accepting chemotaxis protein
MTADAERLPRTSIPPAKRRLRNYLLDARFQLKYTSMVVGVTVVIASALGFLAYRYSRGQTEMMTITQIEGRVDLDPKYVTFNEAEARKADRNVQLGINGGISILALAHGITGIMVTHKLVGPAYKIKRLLRDVRDGHLKIEGRLRKGDELQDVFDAFEEMINALRAEQQSEIEMLDAALEQASAAGVPDEALGELRTVRQRMREALD